VEALESRDVPAAPVITSLNIQPLTGRMVRISGTLADECPMFTSVQIGGKVSGMALTTMFGNFEYVGMLTGPGEVSVVARDMEQLVSNKLSADIDNNAPQIVDFSASAGVGGYWTFSGRVLDESPMGMIVRLGGVPALNNIVMTTVNEDGEFEVTVLLTAGDTGTATAVTTDWWGVQSNTAQWQV
jgi:hypothetical protein